MITDNIPLSCFIVMIVMIVVMMKITTTNSGLLITRRNQSGLEADYHLHTIQLRSIKRYNSFKADLLHSFSTLIMIWIWICNISCIQFNSEFRHFFNIHLDWDDYIFRLVSQLISNYCHFQF